MQMTLDGQHLQMEVTSTEDVSATMPTKSPQGIPACDMDRWVGESGL